MMEWKNMQFSHNISRDCSYKNGIWTKLAMKGSRVDRVILFDS